MIADAPNINTLWAELLVEELVRQGVTSFHISPGSRSAPLALAVAGNPRAQATIHFDERGTAFHALGQAVSTGRPAVLVCTSGTAVANFLPAIVEAAQAHVALIVLTADRPSEMQDTGSNQTIDQTRIFGTYAKWACQLPAPTTDVPPEFILTTVDQAVYRCTRSAAGPVHIDR